MTPSDFCVQAGKDVTAADAASAPQTPEANTRPLERLFYTLGSKDSKCDICVKTNEERKV